MMGDVREKLAMNWWRRLQGKVGAKAPEEDLKVTREVQDGCGVGEGDAVGARDLVEADLGLGGVERPWEMVDVADEHVAEGGSEEAVTFG